MNLLITFQTKELFNKYEISLQNTLPGKKYKEACESNFCMTDQAFLSYEVYNIRHTYVNFGMETHAHKLQIQAVGNAYIKLNFIIWHPKLKFKNVRTLCDSDTTFFNKNNDIQIFNKFYCRFQSSVFADPIMMYFRENFQQIQSFKIQTFQQRIWDDNQK